MDWFGILWCYRLCTSIHQRVCHGYQRISANIRSFLRL
nr:MAG TPA: hypothetical protein [Caudoviricetes sp.]